MAKSDLDVIGPWSEVKLDIIREYAAEYSKILAKQSTISRHVYIDAFAGAGVHVSKSTGDLVAGSPLNALHVTPPFSEYHWIDLNRVRVQGLVEFAGENPAVHVHEGDCNDILLNTVLPRCEWRDHARALCLLDPYKLAVDWQVLERAGQMKSIEIFYNFMIMDVNMNVLWKIPDKVSAVQAARMTRAWGDESWRQIAYKREQRSLLDQDEFIEEKASNEAVAKAFQDRLRNVAGFKYVPDPIPMKNSSGATVYYLFFASPNAVGKKIVEHIFKNHARRAAHGG